MTVYLVNPTTDDTSAACQYGEIVVVNKRYVYGDEVEDGHIPPDHMSALGWAALAFNPKRDYLLLCGDHLQVVVLSAMLARLHGSFRVLRWDRIAKGYFVVKM